MKTLNAESLEAIASGCAAITQLIVMELDSGTWRLNTSSLDLIWNGDTYLGVRAVGGRVEVIEDAPGEIKGLQLELPAVTDAQIATALAEPVQGRRCIVSTAIFSTTPPQHITETFIDFEGRLDVMNLAEVPPDGATPGYEVVQVTAEHIGIDLLRPSGLLYSSADQQRLYPGDNSFEFVIDQSEKQIIFPAASYFKH